jgi:hypothetical protein
MRAQRISLSDSEWIQPPNKCRGSKYLSHELLIVGSLFPHRLLVELILFGKVVWSDGGMPLKLVVLSKLIMLGALNLVIDDR